MSDLRALILLIAAVCVGSLDIRPAFPQGVAAPPAQSRSAQERSSARNWC